MTHADSTSLTLEAIGSPISVSVSGHAATETVAAITSVWSSLITDSEPVRELAFVVARESDVPRFLDSLSTYVTLAAIEEGIGELLMLHAAGFANDAGRVIACVAASGTGKTTLSRAAAGLLSYVSDETVAITDDHGVIRYPKPLSVREDPALGYKVQYGPKDLGLSLADAQELRLGAIVLLHRIGNGRPDDGGSVPRFEQLDLFDAIIALVPELSYLGRTPQPLRRIARALLVTGGATRLVYREAADAIRLLREHPAFAGADLVLGANVLEASEAESAFWDQEIEAARTVEASGVLRPPSLQASVVTDTLIDPSSGRALVFSSQSVTLVSAVAAAALRAAQQPASDEFVRDVLTRLYGASPEQGDPVGQVIDTLVEHGLMTRLDTATDSE